MNPTTVILIQIAVLPKINTGHTDVLFNGDDQYWKEFSSSYQNYLE